MPYHAITSEEQHERDREVHEPGEHRRERDREPREVDLRDQVPAADDARGRFVEAEGKEGPRHEAREIEDRVREPVRRHPGEPPEEQAEDEHGEQRLQHGPRHAERRLLVPDLDVTPDEEEQQLAIVPQLAKAQRRPAARGIDDRQLRVRSPEVLPYRAAAGWNVDREQARALGCPGRRKGNDEMRARTAGVYHAAVEVGGDAAPPRRPLALTASRRARLARELTPGARTAGAASVYFLHEVRAGIRATTSSTTTSRTRRRCSCRR